MQAETTIIERRCSTVTFHVFTLSPAITLGEQRKALRCQKGLTADWLAKQADIIETTIYNWESGKTQP